jgi:hypothetical protein
MTRTKPRTFLADGAAKLAAAQNERSSCLVCGTQISSGEPTIRIRDALIHMRCAVYRRRAARR